MVKIPSMKTKEQATSCDFLSFSVRMIKIGKAKTTTDGLVNPHSRGRYLLRLTEAVRQNICERTYHAS